MTRRIVIIEPRDAVIFRDGRPFDAGLGASSLRFATPSATIGAIRSAVGAPNGFDDASIARLMQIAQVGPFLAVENGRKWQVLLPRPADVIGYDLAGGALRLERLQPDTSQPPQCDLPAGLLPLLPASEEKPSKSLPAFWYPSVMENHLSAGTAPCQVTPSALGLSHLPRQKRMHVSIAELTQTAAEGMLFATEGLEFLADRRRCAIISAITSIDGAHLPAVSHIGGENRTAYWHDLPESDLEWPQPGPALEKAKRIRLMLATPAVFANGWQPAWLNGGECRGVQLKLVAAAVGRPLPLSGWDLKEKAPKATRFLAPAGSVYFCEVLAGDPRKLWLSSLCDQEQDRRDGFGIAVCGVW